MSRTIIMLLSFLFTSVFIWAQKPQTGTNAKTGTKDTTQTSTGTQTPASVKPYKDIITAKAITKKGLFVVHKIDEKWYFEIPDSLLAREILAVTRYSSTPGGGGFYAGELVNQQSVYWEKGPGNKLFLRASIYVSDAIDSTQNIYKAVKNESINPIVASFDIKAYTPGNTGSVIEVTDFFKGDNQVVSLNTAIKKKYNFSSLVVDRSFIQHISTYPINTEVRTIKTFNTTDPTGPLIVLGGIPAAKETGIVTLGLNTSFLLLPKEPMRKRYFDNRVGYFADVFSLYDDNSQKVEESQFIVRWRLEPRKEDVAKFKNGELVEPQKPIIYYIDPATPKKWRKYLIEGVNDWEKAFERAGFKNAIQAKEWPEGDTTMSLEDARFSVIRYFASPISNAYGPNVHDPRSGEIIESHIGWYHNVMKLVHDWYMIQTGAIDPRARKMQFDDELMGQLIRFVSSHEVGHTLGLRHNMGSSSQTPVEKLRDKKWVEANGHTVSIMDYARFNYVAQPEDSVGPAGIYPRINIYDKWAIQWGYKPILNAKSAEEEKPVLNKWIVDSLTADPRLWFGGEGIIGDPRSQSEDLGDNAMKASTYGIKNLQRIIKKLPEWTKEEGDQYENLQRLYNALVDQYTRYMNHVAKNIGGIYITNKSVEQSGDVYRPVPKEILKEAVSFYDIQLFKTPEWLYNETIVKKLGIRPLSHLISIQDKVLSQIINPAILLQVIEMANMSKVSYTAEEYLNDVKTSIWKELNTKTSIDIFRRNLQKSYIEKLGNVLIPPPPAQGSVMVVIQPNTSKSDVQSLIRRHLLSLKNDINKALPRMVDPMTKYHLQDVVVRIDKILYPNK